MELKLLDRYARRTKKVDEAILGVYCAGGNTRRIRKAISPLLGEKHLSKSAVSRVVKRLKELFDAWRSRDLSDLAITYVLRSPAMAMVDGNHAELKRDYRAIVYAKDLRAAQAAREAFIRKWKLPPDRDQHRRPGGSRR